jgi:predicted nucleic acid-binding protein
MYLDTTLLAKQYVKEPDSVEAQAFVARAGQIPSCSELTRMELTATFHRKLREKQITTDQLESLRQQFEFDVLDGRIQWLPLTQIIIHRVEQIFFELPANVFLRTGDAIHLATAAEAGFKEIYSNDKHLLAAATLFKLKGINPLAR